MEEDRKQAPAVSSRSGALSVSGEIADPSTLAEIGIGMLGYAFIGKAHTNAAKTLPYMAWPPPLLPKLVVLGGRSEEALANAARRYGYESWTTDWSALVADPRVELFVNCAPGSVHAEPTIAAARNGKHVLCEKPLGRSAEESFAIWQAVAQTGVKHLCGFNNRFVPAIRLAREMVVGGEIGEIRHFRGRYLQDWATDPDIDSWRFDPVAAGSGTLGDLGAHVIDVARFLVGEIESVASMVETYVPRREVDDAFQSVVAFENGAIGTIEATRLAPGHRNGFVWELNGTRGSIAFDLERLNELQVFHEDGGSARGFKTVLVSEPGHPFWKWWWPAGHTIGWEHSFIHQLVHLLEVIVTDGEVAPEGADFEDGYRASEVCDAIVRSSQSGQREKISYRRLEP